jgi:hypothetical protein
MGAEADIFEDCFLENQQLPDSSRSQQNPSASMPFISLKEFVSIKQTFMQETRF